MFRTPRRWWLRSALLCEMLIVACQADPVPLEVAPREPARPSAAPTRDSGEIRQRINSGRIYVPTYSHIYSRDGIAEDLAVTISIRNMSTERELMVDSVRYFDTSGRLIEEHLQAATALGPLETIEFFVRTKDRRGGSGANFVVGWHADSPVIRPLVEAVMVRTEGPQAYAFSTRGIEIRTDTALPEQRAPEIEAKPAGETPGSTAPTE